MDLNLLISHNYPDLEKDFALWDAYIAALRQSGSLQYFLPGTIGEEWDGLQNDDREQILDDLIAPHEQIFGYTTMPLSITNRYGFGFFSVVQKDDHDKIETVDGGITMPSTGNEETLHFLIHSLARNLLFQRFVDEELEYTPLAQEFKEYNVTSGRMSDERTRLAVFPMPSDFNIWINRPSMQYALQATSYVSKQLGGDGDVVPIMIERLRADFITEQRDILSMLLDHNDCFDESEIYKMFWQERAQDYVDVIMKNTDKFDVSDAIYIMNVAKKSGIEIKEPDNLEDIFSKNPVLKAMHIATRDEVIDFTNRLDREGFKKLTPQVRLHLLSTLGPQEILNHEERMDCDNAAMYILNSWPLHESYLAYYTALFNEMGPLLREKEDLNTLGKEWLDGCDLDAKIAFLSALNGHASIHLGIDAMPILPFSKPMIKREDGDKWTKDAAAFAARHADGESLKIEYGMDIDPALNKRGLIAINTHDDFRSFTDKTPMRASRLLIHEIAHHIAYKEMADDIKGVIGESDPRLAQIKEFRLIDGYTMTDRRLRDEFSNAVYPLIQTEKFQYWVMDEFERSHPFGFMPK